MSQRSRTWQRPEGNGGDLADFGWNPQNQPPVHSQDRYGPSKQPQPHVPSQHPAPAAQQQQQQQRTGYLQPGYQAPAPQQAAQPPQHKGGGGTGKTWQRPDDVGGSGITDFGWNPTNQPPAVNQDRYGPIQQHHQHVQHMPSHQTQPSQHPAPAAHQQHTDYHPQSIIPQPAAPAPQQQHKGGGGTGKRWQRPDDVGGSGITDFGWNPKNQPPSVNQDRYGPIQQHYHPAPKESQPSMPPQQPQPTHHDVQQEHHDYQPQAPVSQPAPTVQPHTRSAIDQRGKTWSRPEGQPGEDFGWNPKNQPPVYSQDRYGPIKQHYHQENAPTQTPASVQPHQRRQRPVPAAHHVQQHQQPSSGVVRIVPQQPRQKPLPGGTGKTWHKPAVQSEGGLTDFGWAPTNQPPAYSQDRYGTKKIQSAPEFDPNQLSAQQAPVRPSEDQLEQQAVLGASDF